MKHKVKVTVLDKKLYPELQQQYCADPASGACPCYNVGDVFVFYRDDERDDFWHMGLNTLVKTNGNKDAHKPHRTRRFISAVRSNADKGYFLVAFGSLLRSRQTVNLIVRTVFFLDFTIKVEGIQFSVAEAVLVLFGLGCPQDLRQP